MDAAARAGDPCGGTLIASQTLVKVDGVALVVVGDSVTPHGGGLHAGALMTEGSSLVEIDGVAVCAVGDTASCGHAVSAGSPLVTVGA